MKKRELPKIGDLKFFTIQELYDELISRLYNLQETLFQDQGQYNEDDFDKIDAQLDSILEDDFEPYKRLAKKHNEKIKQNPWTKDEIIMLLNNTDLSAKELSRHIKRHTIQAINTMKWRVKPENIHGLNKKIKSFLKEYEA